MEPRQAVAARELVAVASNHLTGTVAVHLEFHELVPFKNLLKRFFSAQPWSSEDADRLSALVAPHLDDDWWDHQLDEELTLEHGIREGRYVLEVRGTVDGGDDIFDRVFSGPVTPEPTPHPRKVKFTVGGDPSPGVWYQRTDPGEPDDRRVVRLFAEPDVTDVMVAGDFVTVGLDRTSTWEDRLDGLLALVTELFHDPGRRPGHQPERTRDQLLAEAGRTHGRTPEELHLLDPDDQAARAKLQGALEDEDVRVRRVAVAILAESGDEDVVADAARRGYGDPSRVVRRTAIDAAAGAELERLRPLFEAALGDADDWTRWKAVRALAELDPGPSREVLEGLRDDSDFQVRFEVAAALRRID